MHTMAPVSERLEALGEIAQLGLSLKPPQWARDIVSSVVKGLRIQVDPGTGIPIEIDTGDPDQLKRLQQIIASTRASVTFGQPQQGAAISFGAMQSVPWIPIALAGAGVLLLVATLSRRKR